MRIKQRDALRLWSMNETINNHQSQGIRKPRMKFTENSTFLLCLLYQKFNEKPPLGNLRSKDFSNLEGITFSLVIKEPRYDSIMNY